MEELRQEARAIASAPILVGSGIVLLTALIWGLMHWSYQGLLSGKDAHIVSLDRRLADYRDHLNGASPEEARRRIEALEVEVRTLHIRLTPRRLTGAQRESISDRSRRPSGTPSRSIIVTAQDSCSDCKAFASEIAEALRIADNWTVTSQLLTDLGGAQAQGWVSELRNQPGRRQKRWYFNRRYGRRDWLSICCAPIPVQVSNC